MNRLVIKGGRSLRGMVRISGAKNSVLPILAATLLTDETSVIEGVPHLKDVETMVNILRYLGAKVDMDEDTVKVTPDGLKRLIAPYELVSTMRASFCVLGPLLTKRHTARVSLPGGCVIGLRPVDLHLKGLRALGAEIEIEEGYVHAKARQLRGTTIYLGGSFGSSVLATANVLMAATLAEGRTIIENAACEPEIVDLVNFLIKMGARIKGQRSYRLEIEGVRSLKGTTHRVIPDRIEAATYMLAGLLTDGDVTLEGARLGDLGAVIDKIREVGGEVTRKDTSLKVKRKGTLKSVNITTLPFPGFPTDVQAQMMTLLAIIPGLSVITEKVYPDRFIHVPELNRMGADIMLEGASAIIKGAKGLSGAPVMASDLRASAALILAGLVAKGETEVTRIYHLDRGYERIEEKLSLLGAQIERVSS